MFRTYSDHNRNALGLVVTTMTRFDPTRMANRINELSQEFEKKFFDLIVNDLSKQYRDAGARENEIPWGDVYSQSRMLAKQYALQNAKAQAQQEEELRIQEEQIRIDQERQTEITKRSVEATTFKMPEGIKTVSRGALVMQIAPPTEVKIPAPIKKK